MISQAVPVIEMMNGLEKPIKTFCYKKVHCVGFFSLKSRTENRRFPNVKCDTRDLLNPIGAILARKKIVCIIGLY